MFDLDAMQQVMAAAGTPTPSNEDVPLVKAIGRVLADALPPLQRHGALPAGLRLHSRHMPRLAATGSPTVRVFQKLRVGVLTLCDAREREPAAPDLVGPMLASLLDDIGAMPIVAPRVSSNEKQLRPVLDMLLRACDLVLIAGASHSPREAELCSALEARGARLTHWPLCDELGATMGLAAWNDKVVVCLPCAVAPAFMLFTLLLSPLIRRLQGRSDLLPPSHTALLHAPREIASAGPRFLWARETGQRSALCTESIASTDPLAALALSDGIARHGSVSLAAHDIEAQYYPFSDWLR